MTGVAGRVAAMTGAAIVANTIATTATRFAVGSGFITAPGRG
jgi:hypothetical protein